VPEHEQQAELAGRFQEQSPRLRAVAYRMLGSPDEAEDAVQQAWLRLARAEPGEIENLPGWLTTVVTRICLDTLRSRGSRREDLTEGQQLEYLPEPEQRGEPEHEAVLADELSRALLAVLNTLNPPERIAFVLHDMFAVPFAQIAPILERTPAAAKKLSSRARHKVQGTPAVPTTELARQRQVVTAFLTAARAGDLTGILAVLAPDVTRRADPDVLPPGAPTALHGARAVAEETAGNAARSQLAELAMVNGTVGLVIAPHGRLQAALSFTITDEAITAYDVIADPTHLQQLDLAILPAADRSSS
jgi:RNA polymerase sigma-70 factor (ECF subfamily)